MSRDSRLFLRDIERGCERILRYVGDRSRDEALGDDLILDGVLMNFHVIGEAVKRLPDDLKANHDEVPWRQIAGMRDIVAHVYFAVDPEIIWDAIQHDVPTLHLKIRGILAERGSESPRDTDSGGGLKP